MRVLHLIDAASPQATRTTLAMLADALGRLGQVEQQVLLLGGSKLNEDAVAAGVHDAQLVSTPYGLASLAWPIMRCRLRALGRFDLVHCWSLGAMSLAALMLRNLPRLLTLTGWPSRRQIQWLRVLVREAAGRTVVLPVSNTLRRELLVHGVPEKAAVVLRPAIDMGRVDHDRRSELRNAWGLDGEQVRVAVLLCDPAPAGDAIEGVMTVGLAAETLEEDDAGIRLILHPDQWRRRRAERIVQQAQRPYQIIREPRTTTPWAVLPGCDIALARGPHAGGLSLLWAMAANIAIVGEATYAISEILEDRHSALLAKPGHRNALSNRIGRLLKDRQLAWQLRDTARHEAYSFFSRQRYCQSLKGVYEQLVGGYEVEVQPLEPTGGLRFTGRA